MFELDEDALPKSQLEPLARDLSRLIHGRLLNEGLLNQIRDCLDHHITRIRLNGYKMPDLQIVAFESVGWVEIVRADLEHLGIQRLLQNVIRRFHPRITVEQLLVSVLRAFPDYKPDNAGEESDRVLRVLTEKNDQGAKWEN